MPSRCAPVCALIFLAATASAQENAPPTFTPPSLSVPKLTLPELPRDPSPAVPPKEPDKIVNVYDVKLDRDLALVILGTALWGSTSFIHAGDTPGPWCGGSGQAPCDSSNINALDRTVLGRYDANAALAANIFTGIVPGALTIMDFADAGFTHWRAWLSDAVVVTEAVVWTGATQDIIRRTVRRPRPYMYTPGLNPSARDSPEADFSFFSGHTSNTFAMATATAYTYSLRHPHSKYRWLVWTLAMAGATVEPITRTLSGEHFPSDVIVGAIVGSAAGVLFPALHRRRLPFALTASTSSLQSTVGLSGRW